LGGTYGDVNDYDIDSNYWYDSSLEFIYRETSTNRDSVYWVGTLGWDDNGAFLLDPGFTDPANGDFSRPGASPEMSRTYGGRLWEYFGPDQGGGASGPSKVAIKR
jgi:hypothetical protein